MRVAYNADSSTCAQGITRKEFSLPDFCIQALRMIRIVPFALNILF